MLVNGLVIGQYWKPKMELVNKSGKFGKIKRK